MFTFQCLGRNLDLQLDNKKVVSFKNGVFTTSDEKLAGLVRAKLSNEIWELGAILDQVKLDGSESSVEPEVVKPRRGRPPKTQIVQGMRLSAPTEE